MSQTAATAFDCATTPLMPGVTLIDSSAGTGKTYAIATIVPRLLLEGKAQDITRILVVTFTNAAADELAARIRARLQQALGATRGQGADDPFLRQIRGVGAQRILGAALTRIDELPVCTIHGFCKQALEEAAFESGLPLECEFLESEQELIRQAILDYWRRTVYGEELLAAMAGAGEIALQTFEKEYEPLRRFSGCRVLPTSEPVSVLLQRLRTLIAGLRADWNPTALADAIAQMPTLSTAKDNQTAQALREPQALLQMLDALTRDGGDGAFLTAVATLSAEAMCGAIKAAKDRAGYGPPAYAMRIGEALQVRGLLTHAVRCEVFSYIDAAMVREKQRRNVLSFSDLLQRLSDVLDDPQRGPALVSSMRARYQAVLIDEFQDTDPLQLKIFNRLFRGACPLFFIGDPKQAIYSFRGADIFAYLEAARTADRRHSLDKNWRSEAGAVEAVNALFALKPEPFVFSEIMFPPASAQGKAPDAALADPARSFCHWLLLPAGEDGKALSKERAANSALAGVRAEVLRLLGGAATIGGRPLRPSDLAFLVRTNTQARQVQRMLRGAGVPSVIGGSGSILQSEEFAAVELLLHFIARQEATAALGGFLWGLDAEQMRFLAQDDAAMNEVFCGCGEYRRVWECFGAAAMLRRFLEEKAVLPRLLAQAGGERRLTNLRHALQIVQEGPRAPEALLEWLRRRRQEPSSDRDELRLETDADAAQIVTIHKSKGLEYPVVFCPFLWDGKTPNGRGPVAAHLRGEAGGLVYDCGSKDYDAHLAFAREESLSEDLRLLYVALTRAVHRFYIAWGAVNAAADSGLGWLLGDASPERLSERNPALFSVALIEADEERQVEAYVPHVQTGEAATSGKGGTVGEIGALADGRQFPAGRRLRSWDTCSFTSLTSSGRGMHSDAPAFQIVTPQPSDVRADAAPVQASAQPVALAHLQGDVLFAAEAGIHENDEPGGQGGQGDAFGFIGFGRGRQGPSATDLGNCLHAILERCCLANALAGEGWRLEPELIRQQLADYGLLDPRAHLHTSDPVEAVRALLERVFGGALPGDGLLLAQARACLAEMPFTLPLQTARVPQALETYFADDPAYARMIGALPARALSGYLTGIIDLVFQSGGRWYILDWKSNYLGAAAADYLPHRLREAMRSHHYILQYTLYAVAIKRYLTQRVAGFAMERDFGGVCYGFLRGIDGQGGGWFRIGIDAERLQRLEQELFSPAAIAPLA